MPLMLIVIHNRLLELSFFLRTPVNAVPLIFIASHLSQDSSCLLATHY